MDPTQTISHSEDETDMDTTLTNDQLRKLAKLMYYKGAQSIHTMRFGSVYERTRYLKSCKDCYLNTLEVLKTTETAINEYKDIPTMAPIVYKYARYVKTTVWLAHTAISISSKRAQYIANLKRVVFHAINEMVSAHFNEAKIVELEKEITLLCKIMTQYEAGLNPALRKFSRTIRAVGVTFPKLLRRFQTVLRLPGPFSKLTMGQKIQVLDKVTESLGGKAVKYGAKTLEVLNKYGAGSLYALTALAVAVDIYSADPDKRYETALKDVVTIGTSILLSELETILYVEVAFALVCTGNPYLIALGLGIGAAVYFGGNALESYIQENWVPPVVDFFNSHANEIKLTLQVASFNPMVASLEAMGVGYDKIPPLFKYRPGAFQFYSMFFDKNLDVGPSFFMSPLLSLTPLGAIIDIASGKSKNPALDLLSSIPIIGLFRFIYENFIEPKPKPSESDSGDSKLPIPISTYGLIVSGPQVTNGRLLATRIACKA